MRDEKGFDQERIGQRVEEEARLEKDHRSYQQPRLAVLGDLRDLTLGSSPLAGDSTGDTTRHTA